MRTSPRLIKPKKLERGDIIGVVSPSSSLPADIPNRFKRGVDCIEKLGYKVKIGKNATKKLGYMAGSPQERADDINEMFSDKDVKAIFCSIGGYSSNQILDLIDYKLIKKNPKIFMGYSDITTLLLAIHAKTNLVTFHGPTVMPQFGEYPTILSYTLENMEKVLCQNNKKTILRPSKEWTDEFLDWSKGLDNRPRKMVKNRGWKVLRGGRASGRLIGGNLQTIEVLIGTEYLPSFKDAIFFWEETESSIEEIDRTLTHFKAVGLLDNINGMLVGRLDWSVKISDKNYTLEKVIMRICKDYDFPIMIDMDFGHTDPMITLPIGIKASFDTSRQELILEENSVI
jgi:muramoyltetrapeptide carboxypeptidase